MPCVRGSIVFFCLLILKTLPVCVFLLFYYMGVTIILRGSYILFWGIGFDFFEYPNSLSFQNIFPNIC
ncbi:hypothetical protein GIB67_041639, partial [Kingdonia uniflora]